MNPIAVDDLTVQIATAIYDRRFGYLAVTGTLTGWRRHRYGSGSAELVSGNPLRTRLRLHADRHAAAAIDITFAEAGYDPAVSIRATVHGHVILHPRWGLQLDATRIELGEPQQPATPEPPSSAGGQPLTWPEHITTIGLIDPIDGDDARGDVLAVLDHLALTVVEHRVPVTGPQAQWKITRALDVLAGDERIDVTLVVRGGGADIDLDVFNHPAVVAAITRHPRPVVTGIGHATNRTAADRAADLACITPTAAAHALVNARQGTTSSGR